MRKSILFVLVAAISTALISNGCTTNTAGDTADDPSTKAFTVKTAILKEKRVERNVTYTSTLQPYEEVHFSPASPGRIEALKVEVGDRVSKSDLLAVMDQTQMNQAKVQLANLETDFLRLDTLIKTGSVPQQQYDQIKAQYTVAKSNYEFLQKNTQLRAPFQGIISGKYYEEGEMYSGAPNAQTGKAAIVSIVRINPIKAVINISEQYFPVIKKGIKAVVQTDIYPDEIFESEIIRIYPTVNESTRTFQVELRVENQKEKLRPGMFARINLFMGSAEALLAPSVAVIKQTGTNNRYVFVRENDVAVMKQVVVGNVFNDDIEIISGLKTGEELVVVGQNKLVDQAKIEVVE